MASQTADVGAGGVPWAVASGSDGNLWVTVQGTKPAVLRVSVGLAITSFALSPGAAPAGIIAGPDGALWFTDPGRQMIGRISTAGQLSGWHAPAALGESLALAGDGSLWFAEPNADRMARITITGDISEVALAPGRHPGAVGPGPDGAVWFGEEGAAFLGRVGTNGAVSELALPQPSERVIAESIGPGPAVWYSASGPANGGRLGHLDGAGHLVEQPSSLNVPAYIGLGPDGRLWTVNAKSGTLTATTLTTPMSYQLAPATSLDWLTTGPDGALWAISRAAGHLVRIY